MTLYYEDPVLALYQGDVQECLQEMPEGSVQTVVTSPPYWGLRDYLVEGQLGLEPTPEEYIAAMVEVFREVRRVLRADGTLWLNIGDSYAAHGNGGGSVFDNGRTDGRKSYDADKARGREKDLARIPPGMKAKDLVGIPWMLAFALRADGWWLRQDIIWSKPNPMPESVGDRCTKAHEYLFLLSRSERYYYDAEAIREAAVMTPQRRLSESPIRVGVPGQTDHAGEKRLRAEADQEYANRNKRSVWTVPTAPFPEAHFATFPPDLITPCILAGAPEGGVVLDPFMGSGTTGMVARKLGRRAIGIDLNPDYLAMAVKRVSEIPLPMAWEVAG